MEFLKKHTVIYGILLILFPLMVILGSLFIGRYPVAPVDVWKSLASLLPWITGDSTGPAERIILYLRLPRAILGMLVGGSLALSGASLQGLFRNPLVSSGMLGVSSGAGFGAAVAIILFGTTPMTILSSFSFGLLAVVFSFFVGRIYHVRAHITLVLGGMVIGSLFSAMISFLKYIADPFDQLPAIVFWLMGSLATAGAVCVSGSINWVGLIIPHMGRILTGSDNRRLIPFSFALGGCFLILVDLISRSISGSELPLGILTAFLGAPFFIWLLYRTKARGW